ncbi:MAG: hypothetical protein KDD44_12425, partial [Bdellovibrionales bacterium]|nr:hypothetical protein [Bdellovibrionales bacterium]
MGGQRIAFSLFVLLAIGCGGGAANDDEFIALSEVSESSLPAAPTAEPAAPASTTTTTAAPAADSNPIPTSIETFGQSGNLWKP